MADKNEALRSYFQDGDRWEQEIVKKARRSKSFAWFIALIMSGIALMSIGSLMMLVPLKSFEPYIVEVDKNTGYVEVKTGLTDATSLTDQKAVTQANVVRYIRQREGYDPYNIQQNFGIAALLSTGDAARELQDLWSAANPNNPARKLGRNKKITVDVKSVTFPNASTALVRFSTTESSETDSMTRHFISVIRYRYTDTPQRNEWRFENPLGFQVYNYRRDQETVTPGAAG